MMFKGKGIKGRKGKGKGKCFGRLNSAEASADMPTDTGEEGIHGYALRFEHLTQLGMRMAHGFPQNVKGCGKGFNGKGVLKHFKMMLLQMHGQGILNSKSMAALVLGC